MNLNKILKAIFLFTALGVLAIVGISYRALRMATSRKVISVEIQEKNKQKREEVIKSYNVKEITLTTCDCLSLKGLLITREHARNNILLCHGYRSSKEMMIPFIELFPRDNILLFDFRAHGMSEGDLITIGCYEQRDVFAAVDFLHHNPHTAQLPIIGIGVSMGGATLLTTAAEQGIQFKALIIDSSFANLPDQIANSFVEQTGLPKVIFMPTVLMLFEWLAGCSPSMVMPAVALAKITCPVLIIHSENDTMAPVSNAYRLYAAALSDHKDLWLLKDAKHGNAVREYPHEYAGHIRAFLKNAL